MLLLWVLVMLALVTYDVHDTKDWSMGGGDGVRNAIGPLGAWAVRGLYMGFGVAAWLFPLMLAWLGLILLLREDARPWGRVGWLAMVLGGCCVLAALQVGFWTQFGVFAQSTGKMTGGIAGYLLSDLVLKRFLGWVGAGLAGFGMIVAGLFGAFRVWPAELWAWGKERWGAWKAGRLERQRRRLERAAAEEKRRIELRKQQLALEKEQAKTQRELDRLAHEERVEREREERAAQKERERAERERERAEREAQKERERAERERLRLEQETAKVAAAAELEAAKAERLRLEAEAEERAKQEAAEAEERARREAEEAAEAERQRQEQEKLDRQRRREQQAKEEAERRQREAEERQRAAAEAKARALQHQETPWELPSMDLLDPLPEGADERLGADEAEATGELIRTTLSTFNIEVRVEHIEKGPVVTRYELKPDAGVKVERIAALAGNLTMALKAESVRVEAPIPGKGLVGIEVPNPKAAPVVLRQVLESGTWLTSTAKLPLALGEDVGGQVVVADLTSLPHLLVAGATSMGKSVCLNTLLVGLLMSRTPEELGLILVDPKVVEFSDYAALPHLMVPVITNAQKVAAGLQWAIREMRRRFTLFSEAGVRDIASYNAKIEREEEERRREAEEAEAAAEAAAAEEGEEAEGVDDEAADDEGYAEEGLDAEAAEAAEDADAEGAEEEPEEEFPTKLKYIVIVIDELADLMLEAQAEIEPAITKLTQLARATGIHMIIATQRPTVNIITGTIKSNVPGRIAFKVAQKNDSRVILDREGADRLVRKGDMLVLAGSNKLVRAQGAWTKDNEIRAVVGWWKKQGAPCYDEALKANLDAAEKAGSGKTGTLPGFEGGDDDGERELVAQALEVIRATRRASTSAIQRKLRVGFNRASRIMDLLEEKGYIGPANGVGPREILFPLDDDADGGDEGEDET